MSCGTRARNTEPSAQISRYGADHPRASGEHQLPPLVGAVYVGSSPRERGTRGDHRRGRRWNRIIPARAGNTKRQACSSSRSSDHPRASGEHAVHQFGWPERNGSSPRERGTLGTDNPDSLRSRIIPARAGNTSRAPKSREGDHGSSPRERGTPFLPGKEETGRRIIPARAGNTSTSSVLSGVHADHPRASGEHFMTSSPAPT